MGLSVCLNFKGYLSVKQFYLSVFEIFVFLRQHLFMQRVFYAGSDFTQNKPAAGVAVCRRGGATAALNSLNMMFQLSNMPMLTSQYWNIVYGCAKGEAALDTEGMQTMRTLADNMAWILARVHAGDNPDYPQHESERQGMNFIR